MKLYNNQIYIYKLYIKLKWHDKEDITHLTFSFDESCF